MTSSILIDNIVDRRVDVFPHPYRVSDDSNPQDAKPRRLRLNVESVEHQTGWGMSQTYSAAAGAPGSIPG